MSEKYFKIIPKLSEILGEEEEANHFPLSEEMREEGKRYSPGDEIARGGMKKILRTKDKKTSRDVAQAFLINSEDPGKIESFFREAKLTAGLQHPNIIPLYDAGYDIYERPFFTMKPMDGTTLSKVISENYRKNKIDYHELCTIFLKICDAIAYAHSKDVIHLDLKPENVELGKFGEVLVVDWGLAQVINAENKKITEDNLFLLNDLNKGDFIQGTPGYMAPEQIDSRLGCKDKSSDIYALGAILYTLLCNKAPNDDATIKDTLSSTLDGTLIKPSVIKNSVPSGLEAIAMKALALKKCDRYDSVTSLSLDIKNWQGGYIPNAQNKSFLKAGYFLLKRHKQASCFLALTLIISLFFVLRIIKEKNFAQKQTLIANEQKQIANEQKNQLRDQKTVLESQKIAIEKAFNLFKEEQNQRLIISQKASPHLRHQALAKLKIFDYPNALQNSQLAVLWNPQDTMSILTYSVILMFTQDFKNAVKIAEQISDPIHRIRKQNIIKIASKYGERLNSNGLLAIKDLLQLVSETSKDIILLEKNAKAEKLMIHFVNYAYTQNYSLEEKKILAQRAIRLSSFLRNNWQLNAEIENNKLNIDLSNLKALRRVDTIALLPAKSINLSGSGVKDLSPLYASNFEIANFSDCPLETYQLKFFKNLKSVTLKKDQLPFLKDRNFIIKRE